MTPIRPIIPSGVWTVFRREAGQYLHSPATYVAAALFLLLSGSIFTLIVTDFAQTSVQTPDIALQAVGQEPINVTTAVIGPLFLTLNFVLLFVIPILTMRLFAEERKSGTFELLVSTPLGDWEILLGKYLAAVAVSTIILSVCLAYPIICMIHSRPETPVIVTCFLGLFCMSLAYNAFGVFASSLSENQLVAAVASITGLLLFHLIDTLFSSGIPGLIAGAYSLSRHAEGFTQGVLSLGDILYFILFCAFFLFVTAQILDARRWKG